MTYVISPDVSRSARKGTLKDSDEIMNHTIVLYDAEDMSQQDLFTTAEFVKLPFKLKVAADASAEIAGSPTGSGRIPLPPSFSTKRNRPSRYM